MVEINGEKMSFAQIAALPKEQKDAILANRTIMRPSKREAYDEYELQAANQTEQKIDGNIQAANQRKVAEITGEQAAIEKIIIQIPQMIPLYESRIA